MATWSSAEDNNQAITFDGNAAWNRRHFSVVNCTFTNFAASSATNNGGAVSVMMANVYLIDNITVSNWTGYHCGVVYHKHGINNGTVRRVTAIDNIGTWRGGSFSSDTANATWEYQNCEFCYNNFEGSSDQPGIHVPGSETNAGPFYVYRNSLGNGYIDTGYVAIAGHLYVTENVSTGTHDFTYATGGLTETDDYASVAGGAFNADNTLTSAYLTSISKDRGTIGHEIA